MAGFDEAAGEIVHHDGCRSAGRPGGDPALRRQDRREVSISFPDGRRSGRDPLEKRLPSRVFNYVVRKVSGLALHDMIAAQGIPPLVRQGARDPGQPAPIHPGDMCPGAARASTSSRCGIAPASSAQANTDSRVICRAQRTWPLSSCSPSSRRTRCTCSRSWACRWLGLGVLIGGYLVANHLSPAASSTPFGFELTNRPLADRRRGPFPGRAPDLPDRSAGRTRPALADIRDGVLGEGNRGW